MNQAMILDAIGDALNRTVLAELKHGPLTPGELLDRVYMSRSSLARRVRILRAAGLICRNERTFSLTNEAQALMIQAVSSLAA